jgi:hypothetical protein
VISVLGVEKKVYSQMTENIFIMKFHIFEQKISDSESFTCINLMSKDVSLVVGCLAAFGDTMPSFRFHVDYLGNGFL